MLLKLTLKSRLSETWWDSHQVAQYGDAAHDPDQTGQDGVGDQAVVVSKNIKVAVVTLVWELIIMINYN